VPVPTNIVLKGARLRLRAMQSQMDAAFNCCSTAQNALAVLDRVMVARTAIEKARHTAELEITSSNRTVFLWILLLASTID
jgi:hypothetical protein